MGTVTYTLQYEMKPANSNDNTMAYSYYNNLANWLTPAEAEDCDVYAHWSFQHLQLEVRNIKDFGYYVDVVYIPTYAHYCDTHSGWYTTPYHFECSITDNVCFVKDFNIQNYILDTRAYSEITGANRDSIPCTVWKNRDGDTITTKYSNENNTSGLAPYIRIIKDNTVFFTYLPCCINTGGPYYYNSDNTIMTSSGYGGWYSYNGTRISLYHVEGLFTTDEPYRGAQFWHNDISVDNALFPKVNTREPNNGSGNGYTFLWKYSSELAMKLLACLGIYFKYDGTLYLGYMDGSGQTTGTYLTANEFSKSAQYDKTTARNYTGHEPKAKEPNKDELDNIGLTLNANGNSFINYYACTSANLTALLAWCNTQTEFNGIDWIVGVKQAPCDIPTIASTTATTIHLKGVDTGVNGYSMGNQGSYSTTAINTYNISRYHNNFLDYEPYTHIDLYVPFCGSVSLPPALFMGRTLKTEMIYDIFSGECSCAIFADNTFYTSIGGVFMTQQAVTAEQMGSIHNAVVNGAMSIIGGGVSTVAGVATGNPLMSVGGAISMTGGAVKTYQTINSISPEVRGNSGGRCNFYKPDCYTLLITTPNNITDNDFKKYNGYISNKTLTLSQNMGYTVINNPVITGNMTQQERQEIESYMKSGIIL